MNEKLILIKLKALKAKMDSPSGSLSGINVADYENYRTLFKKYLANLVNVNTQLYGDFVPSSPLPRNSGDIYIGEFHFNFLKNDIQYLLEISEANSCIDTLDLKLTTEGIYFSGQTFDAFSKVTELLKGANYEIILIDGYLNDQFIDIFTIVNASVKIKILTKLNSHNPAVNLKIEKFNEQFLHRQIKIEMRENPDFHDRFLILDKKEYYHFGASLKDAGKKGFMFSKIEEQIIQQSLLKEFNSKWQ
ncbi:MAG: hypothetical protein Q8K92_07455 [Leadbetterella sp.]|nr:hypothetical protein [Leadbetterella sp.]